jgi:hypothetical protein
MKANDLRIAFFSTIFGIAMFGCAEPTEDESTGSSEAEIRRGPSAPRTACVGVKVPGDYATVQSAIDSGAAKICLKAGTFDEAVHVVAPQKVAIQGVGARSILRSMHVDRGGLELAHVTVSEGVSVVGRTPRSYPYPPPVQKVHVHDAWLRSTTNVVQGVYGEFNTGVYSSWTALNVILDERDGLDVEIADCDISATPEVDRASGNEAGGNAVLVNAEPETFNAPSHVAVRLSFHGNAIHDSAMGLEVNLANLAAATLEIRDNRISRIRKIRGGDSGTALDISLSNNGSGTRVSYDRNELTRSVLGASVFKYTDAAVLTHQGNVFANNVTNYAGVAQPD